MLGEVTVEANLARINSGDSKVTTGASSTVILYKKGSSKRPLVLASKNLFFPIIVPKFPRLEKNTNMSICTHCIELRNDDFFIDRFLKSTGLSE